MPCVMARPLLNGILPVSMEKIKENLYGQVKGGDRDFVELLMMVQEHGIEAVDMACELALEQGPRTCRSLSIWSTSLSSQ